MYLIIRHQGQVPDGQGMVEWNTNDRPQDRKYFLNMFYQRTPTIPSTGENTFATFGHELLGPHCVGRYSKHLIELVLACLAYFPSVRPTAEQVFNHARDTL